MEEFTTVALPTRQELIDNLPFVPQPTDEACYICFDAFDAAPAFRHGGDLSDEVGHRAVQTPCAHVYGEKCLDEWLKLSPLCPMCRRVLCHAGIVDDRAHHVQDPAYDGYVDEMETVVEEMTELGLALATRDFDNRAQLVQLFDRIVTMQREQPEEVEALGRLFRSISALSEARVVSWLLRQLDFDDRDCREQYRGDVDRSAFTSAPEGQQEFVVVDAAGIVQRLEWYYFRALESASFVYDHTRHRRARCPAPWAMIFHPAALNLTRAAISMMQRADGARYTVAQMRQELETWLRAHREPNDRMGLDAIEKDLLDVVMLTLCGLPVRLEVVRTVDGPEKVTYGVEEPEIVDDTHEWLFSRG